MLNHEERRAETERLLALLPAARDQLAGYPGVVRVSVGVRERADELVEDEFVFRVHVEEKRPESELAADEVIPNEVLGVPTDVITRRIAVPEIGFDDENDHRSYTPKVGGTRIGAEVAGGTGTLGCFCRRTSDDAVVLLSNHHVLIDPGGAVGDGVGHPRWRKSCCCTCGKIAEVSAFDEALDCAIAKLDSGVDYAPKIRRIMRSDGTKELEGTIAGSAAPVLNDEVWKVGARTGLTRGTIADIDPTEVEVQPLAAFPRMSNSGDSGSVYVSLATGNVCGLHHSGDGTNAFGSPIDQVEAALGIVVIPTDVAANYPVVDWIELGAPIPVEAPFDGIVEQLTCSPAGQRLLRLFEVHRDECLELVTTCRAFTVAWHRAQGPAYLAALARSARDPDYRIPRVFAGIDRAQAADRLAAVLRAVASDELVADLDEHGHGLRRAIVGGDDIDELIDLWEGSRLLAG